MNAVVWRQFYLRENRVVDSTEAQYRETQQKGEYADWSQRGCRRVFAGWQATPNAYSRTRPQTQVTVHSQQQRTRRRVCS